jgi:NifB/MoaA-like Fe-S oxidoreductase
MKIIDRKRGVLKKELGSSFIYLSDEFYIRTGIQIPASDYYEGFYQLENGVGLTRDLIVRFREELPEIKKINPHLNLTFISAKLGAAALRKYIIPELSQLKGLKIKLYQAANYFYGTSIIVAGLLVGRDIYNHLKNRSLGEYIILPPRVLNHDGIFLDDWTVAELEQKLKRKIFIFPDSFLKLFQNIQAAEQESDEEVARKIRHSGPSLYVAEHMKSDEKLFETAIF